jgi:opacity protein-like surface antigen
MFLKRLLPACFAAVICTTPIAHAENADNFNAHFGPVALLLGVVDAGLDIAVHDNWTVGPEIEYMHWNLHSTGSFTSDYDITAFAIGGRANWYANGVYTDGLYVSPQFAFANAKVSTTDSSGISTEGTASSLIVRGVVGYGWFWDSFNIHLGGGLALPVGRSKVKMKASNGTEESVDFSRTGRLALEFNLGWTF